MEISAKRSVVSLCKASLFFVIVLFVWSCQRINVYSAESGLVDKRALFISSYSESFITVPDQISGIQSVLDAYGVKLEIEYMDTKRFSTEENLVLFKQTLAYKLENGPTYDVVLVGDDAALQFAMDHREDLFQGIPVIFFGINDKERAKSADELPDMAGGVEETSLRENIDLAKKLRPKAKKVAAIVDNTLTGQGDQKQFELACQELEGLEPIVLNVSEGSFDDFGRELEQLGQDTILFLLSMNQDSTGHI